MNLAIQHKLAIASQLCYERLDLSEHHDYAHGVEFISQHSMRSHSLSLFHFADSAVIAFRGTNELADWRTNLLLVPTKRPWGWVHLGFARAAEALWPVVKEKVSEGFGQGRRLYVTGHSLGGAIAVISALKLIHELDQQVSGLVTFGQPPLAGKTAVRSLEEAGLRNYPRNISSVDVVATGPFMPFFHAGAVQYFDAYGQMHKEMSWLRYLRDAVRLGWRFQIDGQVKKHFMANYVSLIQEARDKDFPA